MLLVTVAVALVSAAAVDLAYQARVSLEIAANGRDALKAEGLARGSVNLSRLVLRFQGQIDQATARGLAGVGAQAALNIPRPQIWRLVPVDSTLAEHLFGGAGAAGARDAGTLPAAGAGEARFDATIDDEDRKVNAQLDGLEQGGLLGAQVASFMALLADRKWDFLFDREDENGVRMSRGDLAIHLRDWTDDDQQQSSLTGIATHPFEAGFGDENFYYDRGPDRYKAKNARFDSLDELYLVAGVSDELMAAFGERLTVYMSKNSGMNVNTDVRDELVRNARIMADPPNQPILSDPTFPERLENAVKEVRMGGLVSISPFQFAGILEALGLGVNPDYTQQRNVDKRGGFTDKSQVFRIRGHGRAGRVDQTIEAVVTFDPSQAREEAGQLGRLLHWHEE